MTFSANTTDTGMGILLLYRTSQPSSIWNTLAADIGIPYFSLTVSLNVLLTLIIVGRLILHGRNIRRALGTPTRTSGLYGAVITILVESSAIYAVTSLLFIGPWIAKNRASDIFLPILAEVQVRSVSLKRRDPWWHSHLITVNEQVIAPFLIVIRVADRRALTGTTTTSGNTSSTHQGKSTNGSRSLPSCVYPMNSVDSHVKPADRLHVGVETTIDLHCDNA